MQLPIPVTDCEGNPTPQNMPMAKFLSTCPGSAAWMESGGGIEIGDEDHSKFCICVSDEGRMCWDGKLKYGLIDAA